MTSKLTTRLKIITICAIFSLMIGHNRSEEFYAQSEKVYNGSYQVIMISVHDGDTFAADIPDFPPVIGDKIGIRLDGIDTPELNDKRPEIKILAQKARLVLLTSLKNAKRIIITNIKRDKYFRLDATVIADGVNLNELMIKLELAKPYNGGKKSPW